MDYSILQTSTITILFISYNKYPYWQIAESKVFRTKNETEKKMYKKRAIAVIKLSIH